MERSINYFKVILSLGGADCDHVLILVERSYHFCACAQEFDNFIDLVQCRTQFERNPWIESIEIQFD